MSRTNLFCLLKNPTSKRVVWVISNLSGLLKTILFFLSKYQNHYRVLSMLHITGIAGRSSFYSKLASQIGPTAVYRQNSSGTLYYLRAGKWSKFNIIQQPDLPDDHAYVWSLLIQNSSFHKKFNTGKVQGSRMGRESWRQKEIAVRSLWIQKSNFELEILWWKTVQQPRKQTRSLQLVCYDDWQNLRAICQRLVNN